MLAFVPGVGCPGPRRPMRKFFRGRCCPLAMAESLEHDAYAEKVEQIMAKIEREKRATKIQVSDTHHVLGTPMNSDFLSMGYEMAMFGMGCYWGAEKLFWQQNGVYNTAVGYTGGSLENPTYKEVCAGTTGHVEVVRIVYDPKKVSYFELLNLFWSNHETTTPNRQGPDVGTQYRSAAYWFTNEQKELLEKSRDLYQKQLDEQKLGTICTEIAPAPTFYFAEDYMQAYLEKNPWATCQPMGPGVYEPMLYI